jgi:hypothetical protein
VQLGAENWLAALQKPASILVYPLADNPFMLLCKRDASDVSDRTRLEVVLKETKPTLLDGFAPKTWSTKEFAAVLALSREVGEGNSSMLPDTSITKKTSMGFCTPSPCTLSNTLDLLHSPVMGVTTLFTITFESGLPAAIWTATAVISASARDRVQARAMVLAKSIFILINFWKLYSVVL